MEKTLNFNTLQRPTLLLTMCDEEQTQIKVSTPTEALIEELNQTAPEMMEVVKTGNKEGIEAVYDLAARLMSCNRSFITVTAEDLRNKYKMDLESLIVFFSAYLDFINAITNEKN